MKKIMFNDRYGLTEAVIEGRKTETRRIELKDDAEYIARHWNPKYRPKHCYYRDARGFCQLINSKTDKIFIPKYQLGEIVAVAQSYKDAGVNPDYIVSYKKDDTPITAIQSPGWTNKMFIKPDIHVWNKVWNKDGNRFFCTYLIPHRIRITGIRIERLQEIIDEDCLREGIRYEKELATSRPYGCSNKYGAFVELGSTPREAFAALIDKVSGRGTWDINPYVVVYEFKLEK
jgi:hypothetical protein